MGLLLADVLECAAAGSPQQVAVTLGEDALSFAEVRDRSYRTANALLGLGVRSGDRVAWWSDIDLRGVALYFGCGRAGAAFAPLNPAFGAEEAAAVVAYLRPRLLVVDAARAEAAAGYGVPLAVTGWAGGACPGTDFDAAVAAASPSEPAAPPPDEHDIATIFLTSGSTGRPKGVMISHRATWLRTHAGASAHQVSRGKGDAVMFPLFHMAGWNFSGMAWSGHRAAHLVRRADGAELLGAIARHRAGTLYCIPAVWRRILEVTAPFDVSSVEWALTGTSAVGTDLLAEIRERFPAARTTVNYGSTETGRSVALGHDDLFRKPGSVGIPIPGVRARLDDGELLLSTDRVMSGYFDLPEETAAVLGDGWYRTGDLAEIDGEGYVSVVGRRKEVIRTGGETVAPAEVEAVIASHPAVLEAAVIGLPDAEWGELVCAVVVARPAAAAPSVAELRDHIGTRLAAFKHPRRVVTVDRLPRTAATGQVQRARLQQAFGS
ncbi:MAG TPA: class I adenylate-forming enzyme family protein [Acidimicrobiales bacterium]|nr:class I adenylate-forming enzyme family protein [Acidimicrobiales bacterium]